VLGEDAAAAFLAGQGLVVLDRNWRCREGEIDIVAATPSGTVVVVEVKTRTGTGFGMPVLAVTAAKYARLRRLAARWLTAHDAHARAVRIDVVAVLATPRGEICDIDHIAGAFR
jgi:putative endonuclease